MKRLLLFFVTLFYAATATWATPEATGNFGANNNSEWSLEDGVLTLTFKANTDIPTSMNEWGYPTGPLCTLTDVTKVVVITDPGVSLSGTTGYGSPLNHLNAYYKTVPVLDLSSASFAYEQIDGGIKGLKMYDNSTFMHIIVPNEFSSAIDNFRVLNIYWGTDDCSNNKYSISGTTVKALLKTTDYTSLSNLNSDATTLKLYEDVAGALNLSSVLESNQILDLTAVTTASTGSNSITVDAGVKVVCLTEGVKNRVTGTDAANITVANPVISCTASELSGKLTTLRSMGVAPTSITITSGELSATDITSLNIEGLTYLNLQEATIASINDLTIPSSLTSLTLPKGTTPTPETTFEAFKANGNINGKTNLMYVYAPYSGTQDKNQMIADYVWVNQPGGLDQALDNEGRLRTAVYVKVESDVALNNDDANFGSHFPDPEEDGYPAQNDENYPWQYIDFTGTVVTAEATLHETAPFIDKGYRIILPNGHTGDHMAIFASNANKGAIAAIYSYNGTTLNLMELTDQTYHTDALADSRIVRDGTTAVRVLSGSYGGTTYSKIGPNLVDAINGAKNSITSVTIAVGDGVYKGNGQNQKIDEATTFAFDNDNITNLTMNYVTNQYLTVDVSGCSALTSLYMNETDFAAIDAHGITGLATVSLGHATVGGDVNLSGTDLNSLLEVDLANITGTLNVSGSNAEKFDFTQLTAKSVDASNTDALKKLDLDGIMLSGMSTADDFKDGDTHYNIEERVGTVELSRTSGNYDGLTITLPTENKFDVNRLIPSLEYFSKLSEICYLKHDTWENAWNTWLAANYTNYINEDTKTANYNAYVTGEYDTYLDGEYNTYKTEKENAGETPLSKDDWVNSNPEGVFTTQAAWVNSSPKGLYNINEWSSESWNYDKIINLETATAAFAATFEAWLSQNYSSYQTERVNTDYDSEGGNVSKENWLSEHYTDTDPDSGNYIYVTTAARTEWEAKSEEERKTLEPAECDIKDYTTETIEPAHTEITIALAADAVGRQSLCDKIGENILDLKNGEDDGTDGTADSPAEQGSIEILHLTGTLTADDLVCISGMSGMRTLDLSGCTLADGLTYQDIKNMGLRTTVAIILPGSSNTEEEMLAAMFAFQDAKYECVGYYTQNNNDGKKLNVYTYNGTFANLKTGLHSPQVGVTQPKLIDTNTDITFLRCYKSGSNIAEYYNDGRDYPQAQPSLLTSMSDLFTATDYPFTVDMTWLNISNLGNDFSNVKCRYLVIPQNTSDETTTRNSIIYHNDFTDETTNTNTDKYYTYNESVYAVSTYKDNHAPYAAEARFNGDALSYNSDFGHKNCSAYLTYLRSPGVLDDIAPHISSQYQEAKIFSVAGTINNDDIDGLEKLQNPLIDLTRATLTETGEKAIDWSGYSSANVESIALPYGYTTTLSGLPTLGTCPELKGIGTLEKTEEVVTGKTSKKSNLVYQAYKAGGMDNMILMLHALNQNERQYVVNHLTVGGPVVAKDISTRTEGIDENGHLATEISGGQMVVKTSETGGGYGALGGCSEITWFDLSKATLPTYNTSENKAYCFNNDTHDYIKQGDATPTAGYSYQNDLCFTMLGIAPSTTIEDEVKLPTGESVWRLPDNALNNCKGLKNICLPRNYQYIGNGAMLNSYIQHITTTDAGGNIVDNGPNTYNLSDNLKQIGNAPETGTLLSESQTIFPQNRPVYDCYVLATKTPKCQAGSFPANMYYGWGGFEGSGVPYCRDKYKNDENYFTVLRFPSQESYDAADADDKDASYDLMQKQYTDVTKVYTKKEQTGAVDANGKEIVWPTFSELRRAYNQATAGITWNNWKATYDSNYEVNGGDNIPTYATDLDQGNYTDSDAPGNNDLGIYTFTGYEGWHQFTLSQATYVETVQQNAVEREYEKGGWYTFCIPYDMTYTQVKEWLGVPASNEKYINKVDGEVQNTDLMPDVRQLSIVTRHNSNGSGDKNVVAFRLTTNLITASTAKRMDFDHTADPSGVIKANKSLTGDICLQGGVPYIIQPYLRKGESIKSWNLGQYIMTRYGDQFKKEASCYNHGPKFRQQLKNTNGDELATLMFAKPYEDHMIQAVNLANESEYLTWQDGDTPRRYYYALVGQFWEQKLPRYCIYQSRGTWYRNSSVNNFTWQPFKCIIMAVPYESVDYEVLYPVDFTGTKNFVLDYTGQHYRDKANSRYPLATIQGKADDNLSEPLKIAFLDGRDDYDDFPKGAQYMFTFDDFITEYDDQGNEVTAIETLDGETMAPTTGTGKVYNTSGQYVGTSTEGLPKGLYIINGRKVVVK